MIQKIIISMKKIRLLIVNKKAKMQTTNNLTRIK